jgi:uncharacterized membrane protein
MQIFDIVTILCVGLMIGAEFTVSAFINPIVWQLEDYWQAKILSLFARRLGTAMPRWYALSLLLMLSQAYLRRHEPALLFLLVAAGIWMAVILYTIAALVPINKRMEVLESGPLAAGWRQEHRQWDTLNRWRIFFLIVAMVFLLQGILG